jgi:hypothetical protein
MSRTFTFNEDPDGFTWDLTIRYDAEMAAWFRRHIAHAVEAADRTMPEQIRRRVVAHVCSQPFEVLVWQDADEYRGEGFCNGWWALSPERADKVIAAAMRRVAAELEAESCPTLDAWLAELQAGRLKDSGPREPAGASLCSDPKTLRRQCRACGKWFRPETRNTKDCELCRAARTAAAEAKQQAAVAAISVGARFLAATLKKYKTEPYDFPEGKAQSWLTHGLVRSWLEAVAAPRSVEFRVLFEHHWGNVPWNVLERVLWSFRRAERWPERIRETLTGELVAADIKAEVGGTDVNA